MIEIISTTPRGTGDVLRTSARNQEQPASPVHTQPSYVSPSIRVDNVRNVAVLQFRSSDTGEVLEEYPTRSHIEAFRRAERLREAASEAVTREAVTTTQDTAQAPASPSPAPVSAAAPAPDTASSAEGDGTSVVV